MDPTSDCKEGGEINRRNGHLKKQMKTGTGSFELETPRDREGSFEPEIVKKRRTVLNESLDNKVLSLYALEMSYDAIADHLAGAVWVRDISRQNQLNHR